MCFFQHHIETTEGGKKTKQPEILHWNKQAYILLAFTVVTFSRRKAVIIQNLIKFF